jgi:TRAP-type C4-dicarboxylate transport system substrate-binding protein
MKKSNLWLGVTLSFMILIFMVNAAVAGKINIDVNCTMKPGGASEASINKFKEIVEKESGGRMNVKIFMSGQLGKEKAILELLKLGQTPAAPSLAGTPKSTIPSAFLFICPTGNV